MSPIDDIQNEIIEEFEFFDQWMDKYEYIIDLGKKLSPLEEKFRQDENLIPGCQSRVWLHAEMENDRITFTADSDAVITKGIIALLIRVLSHQTAEQISKAELYFIDRIGLKEHLSPTRSNGLVSMVMKIKAIATHLKSYH
ncbi:MAG: SufE family protein [Gammaproteobacteria bacterium]|nr:SufE family protein [Gammaproteobacteria bacterium]